MTAAESASEAKQQLKQSNITNATVAESMLDKKRKNKLPHPTSEEVTEVVHAASAESRPSQQDKGANNGEYTSMSSSIRDYLCLLDVETFFCAHRNCQGSRKHRIYQ